MGSLETFAQASAIILVTLVMWGMMLAISAVLVCWVQDTIEARKNARRWRQQAEEQVRLRDGLHMDLGGGLDR